MKTVVIIDDQYTMRVILAQVIENINLDEDIRSMAFSEAEVAYNWLANNSSDLIIVDYMMDKMSGHELLKKLKSNDVTRAVPIVAITSDSDLCIRYQLLEDGAIDFMVKPLDYHECMLRFRNLLRLNINSNFSEPCLPLLPMHVVESKAA